MITDFEEFKKYLTPCGVYNKHLNRTLYWDQVPDPIAVLYTTFITYNESTNKVTGNSVCAIIAADTNSSSHTIVFAAPTGKAYSKFVKHCREKMHLPDARINIGQLPTCRGVWNESGNEDMIKWEIPIFKTPEEANEYRLKMYKAFCAKRNAIKENCKKNTVTLEEIANKFCIDIDNLIIEGVWNDKFNKKRKK